MISRKRCNFGATTGTVNIVLPTAINSRAVKVSLVIRLLSSRMLTKMIMISAFVCNSQPITEDFAQLVIPKVWEKEGRKVSRVASKLSISPKKVRRILSKVGLLGLRGGDDGED